MHVSLPKPLLLALVATVLAAAQAWALVPERRRDFEQREPNEYLLVPAVASLPGVGTFVGVIAATSNLGDTGIDVGAAVAQSVDGSDIKIRAIAVQDMPLLPPGLTFDFQVADLSLGNFEVYLPGRDSPNFTIPISAEFRFYLLRPNLRLFRRRFNLSYTLGFFKGFDFDSEGNEIAFAQHSLSYDVLLDLTDDVVDPRKGVRLDFTSTLPPPKSSFLGKDTETKSAFGSEEGITVRQTTLAFYLPFARDVVLAWNNQFFEAIGGEDAEDGTIIAGGSPPLRGYPANRWSDRYGVFHALELRIYYPQGERLNHLFARGVLEDFQFALFYEVGQVSPTNDHTLYEQMHQSYGAGFRVLLQAIVLRLDLANSDEGLQTHLTAGYSF